jgi:hypothetical protein
MRNISFSGLFHLASSPQDLFMLLQMAELSFLGEGAHNMEFIFVYDLTYFTLSTKILAPINIIGFRL